MKTKAMPVAAHPGRLLRRRSKAARLIVLASFALITLTGMEAGAADPLVTQQVLAVEHVKIVSTKTFAAVEAALDGAVPQLDPAISVALAHGDEARAGELERGAALFIFEKRDHGALLQITGRPRKAVQYEIGNPLTATKMTRHKLPAALYAPLRVVLYENEAGGATFEYDKPSTLFGQFGDEQVTAVGHELDAELERALRRAAEWLSRSIPRMSLGGGYLMNLSLSASDCLRLPHTP